MSVQHPAKYSDPILPVLARYVDGARTILDPFAGTGRVGLLRQHLRGPVWIYGREIEAEWAAEAAGNGCDHVSVGDSRCLPWGKGVFEAVTTSPAYGNRMADACDWAPGRKHSTYTSALRETVGDPTRDLRPGNAGALQWGDAYRRLHREVWAECWRVLRPGGRLVLNVADHYRDGKLQGVPKWHVSALLGIGFHTLDVAEVETQRYGFGANADLRAPELVICLYRPPFQRRHWAWRPELPRPDLSHPIWDVWPEPQQLSLLEAP